MYKACEKALLTITRRGADVVLKTQNARVCSFLSLERGGGATLGTRRHQQVLAFKCFASSSASGEDEQVEKNQKNKTQQQDFKWKRMTGGIPDAMKVSGEDSVSLMTGRVKTKTTLCEERRREEREEKEMGGRENRLPLLFLFRFFF